MEKRFLVSTIIAAGTLLPACRTNDQSAVEQDSAVTVNLYYRGSKGNAKKFVREMTESGVVGAIRAESGNLKYQYFFPAEDDETVLLIDSWKDRQSLDKHHASPMMKKIAELRERYDLHTRAEYYHIDNNGVPSVEKKFLRE